MDTRQGRLIEALDRVEEFLTTSGGPRLAAIVTSAAHDHPTASRARMVVHMTTQDAAARSTREAVGVAQRLRA